MTRSRFIHTLLVIGATLLACAGAMPQRARLPNHSVGLSLRGTAVSSSDSTESNYDVKSYTIALRIDPDQKSISGNVTITATATSPSLRRLSLDLENSLTVESVESKGRGLKFIHDQNRLTMELRHRYERGS